MQHVLVRCRILVAADAIRDGVEVLGGRHCADEHAAMALDDEPVRGVDTNERGQPEAALPATASVVQQR